MQAFFIVASTSSQVRRLDVNSFENLQQLKSTLASAFNFTDHKNVYFHNNTSGSSLDSFEAIKKIDGPIELRTSQSAPIQIPPGPKGLPFVGNHYELYPDPLGNYDRLFARYGRMFKTVNMGTTIYHTNDPEIARHVLKEGEFFTKTTSDRSHPLFYMNEQDALFTCDSSSPSFKWGHKFVPPAMSPRAMAHHTPLLQRAARTIFPVLDELEEKGLSFNVYQYMFKMAGQLVWSVIVNQDLEHFKAINTPPTLAIRLFGQYLKLMKSSSLRPKWYGYLPYTNAAKLKGVRDQLWKVVGEAMDNCVDKNGETLQVSDPMASLKASCVADFLSRARDDQGQALPPAILIANVVVLLGAGFTTSSSMLTWCLYSFVKYPGNQERFLQELIDHGADGQKAWTYEEIHSMKFLDCFIKEVQRRHSPAFQTARNAKKDCVLPGGYLIPAGSVVIPCFPSMHHNPKHWENPHQFNPDRWASGQLAVKARQSGLYTPFAAGERGCIGFNFALTELKIALAEFIYAFEFEDASTEAMIYDPEFLVTRPLNFYASPRRRTTWPSRSK